MALLDPKAQTKRDKDKLRKQAARERARDPAKQEAWNEKQEAKKKEAARTKEARKNKPKPPRKKTAKSEKQKKKEAARKEANEGAARRDLALGDMTTMTQADFTEAVTTIDMKATTHQHITRLSQDFIDNAPKFYKNTKSAKRPSNDGQYNDADLYHNRGSVGALKGSCCLMRAIHLKHKDHRPKGGRASRLILFEQVGRIGFHADSAGQSTQRLQRTKAKSTALSCTGQWTSNNPQALCLQNL